MAATPSAAAVAAPAPHVPAGPPGGGASGPTQFAQNVALHVSDLAASTTEVRRVGVVPLASRLPGLTSSPPGALPVAVVLYQTHLFDLFNSVSPVASIRLCRDMVRCVCGRARPPLGAGTCRARMCRACGTLTGSPLRIVRFRSRNTLFAMHTSTSLLMRVVRCFHSDALHARTPDSPCRRVLWPVQPAPPSVHSPTPPSTGSRAASPGRSGTPRHGALASATSS